MKTADVLYKFTPLNEVDLNKLDNDKAYVVILKEPLRGTTSEQICSAYEIACDLSDYSHILLPASQSSDKEEREPDGYIYNGSFYNNLTGLSYPRSNPPKPVYFSPPKESEGKELSEITEWINVKDRKPKERYLDVLVFNGDAPKYNQCVRQASWFSENGGKFILKGNEKLLGTTTHWMKTPNYPTT